MVRINNKTAKKYKSLLDLYLKDADLLNYNKTFIDLFDQRTNKKQLISKETVRSCLSAIIWKLKQSNGNTKLIKEYQLFMTHMRKSCLYDTRSYSILKTHIPRWYDIIQIRNELQEKVNQIKKQHPIIIIADKRYDPLNKTKLNKNEKSIMKKYLISCLYTYNPPRRLLDYGTMIVVSNKKEYDAIKNEKEFVKHNFYLYDNNCFVFQYYKTVKTYNVQSINVNNELNKIIKSYIHLMGIDNREQLFNNYDISHLVINTFGCGINGIRHSYITYLYELRNGKLDYNEIERISRQMGHNIESNIGYCKNSNEDTITFKSLPINEYFNNNNVLMKRLLTVVLFSIILIVIKICTIRMKKYSSKKKKRVSVLSITPMQYDSLDKFIKK